jgi:DNA polymerase-3 subunit alpha (Gram-positive type)
MIQDYVCVDIETTGLDPRCDKIIEIGAVKVRKGEIVETFQSFVNPGRILPEKIVELTGICDEDLRSAKSIEQVIPMFLDFSGEDMLLGHSVLFDYSFIKKAIVNMDGKNKYEKFGIDTLKISRKHLASLESRRLSYLCTYYGIEQKAHRALGDAIATHFLYQRLLQNFYVGNELDFTANQLIYNVKRETPITKAQKERLSKLITLHNIDYLYDLDCLTRNEASRITDQILATYGR